MNEKIKELVRQAGGIDDDDDGYELTPILVGTCLEKFAELIVRECAKVADVADENKCEWIGGNVLTHFGVKE